ncbi:MAG: BadF/BadG/BcrA/BcrD ATPase family protein [Chloroflexota bacterium]
MRVLAVDGGQSAIRLRHSSGERVVEVHGVSRLEGDTVDSVASAIAQGWLGSGFGACDRVVLGLSTAPADEPSQVRLCRHVNRVIGASDVWLADDTVTCHAGSLSLGWGVSITAGTGVACLVVPEAGEPRVLSGHGYLLGDEGGAFWIGREGLRAALRASDGRGPATALVAAAAARFGGLADLGIRVHSVPRPVNDIAHFAPDVLGAADAGDVVAERIAQDAADELVVLMEAAVGAARTGSTDQGMVVPVAVGGRLLAEGRPLRRRLEAQLAERAMGAAVRTADGTSLDGALALGMRPDPGRYASLVHVWREPAAVSAQGGRS